MHPAQQRSLVLHCAAAVPDDARRRVLALVRLPELHQGIQQLRADTVRGATSAQCMLVQILNLDRACLLRVQACSSIKMECK